MTSLPFSFARRAVTNGSLTQEALIMEPFEPMVVGPERLARIQGVGTINEVEEGIVRAAAGSRLVILRGANDQGEQLWSFDDAMSDAELAEAGRVMTLAILPLHRHLVAAGVMLFVHSEWGIRDCFAMREGLRLSRERERPDPQFGALDAWILEHVLLYATLGVSHIVENLMPAHLSALERRRQRVEALLAEIPRSAFQMKF